MVKLLRNNVMADGGRGGLWIPNGDGNHSLLDRESFKEVVARDAGELRLCPKLTDLCIEVSGCIVPFHSPISAYTPCGF